MAFHICIVLSLGFFALYLLYEYLSWNFDKWRSLGVRGPRPKLIYGNFPSLINGKRNIAYDHYDVYSAYKKTDRVIGVFASREPQLFLLDPQLGVDVMVKKFGKFRDNLAASWISPKCPDKIARRNPFLSFHKNGWKTTRTDILPGLSQHKLNAAYPLWQSSAKKMREYLQQQVSESKGNIMVDSRNLSYRFTANVMCDFLWGIESETFSQTAGHPNTIMKMMSKMLANLMQSIGYYFQFSWAPVLRNFFYMSIFPADTDRFFSNLTKEAMAVRSNDAQKRQRDDFLNHVMQLQEKKNLSHDDAVGYIMTSQLDGYETAANALMHALYYLARYPEVQEKLRREIVGNLGKEEFLSFEVLNSLPYLDQCVHETIRLITPIPWFARVCTEATSIDISPTKSLPIDVGTVVIIPTFSYHHDPDYFPEPFVFKPERFDNNLHHDLIKQGVFIPFGNGPRICLGMRMGLFEVKTAVVELLQKYRLKCTERTVNEKKPDSNAFLMGLDGDLSLCFEPLTK